MNFLRQLVIKEVRIFEPFDTINVSYRRGMFIVLDEDNRKSEAYRYTLHLPC